MMENKTVMACRQCGQLLRVPTDRGRLQVRCPNCQSLFYWSAHLPPVPDADYVAANAGRGTEAENKGGNCGGWPRKLKVPLAIAALVGLVGLIQHFSNPDISHAPRWTTISYDGLIERAVITHSGRTVGEILEEIGRADRTPSEQILSDLQPYLEPFSFVCNEVVTAAKPSGGTPYLNVVADYPPGSAQPAWAALFREGLYQLYVGDGRARLFLKGENPNKLLDQYHSVVRHALHDVVDATDAERIDLEVYAFENNYQKRDIRLDLAPYVVKLTAEDLSPRTKDVSLGGLSDFFEQGLTLEAAEIDNRRDLYLYGKPGRVQTVAGQTESLEDFAVVYRSVFHYGHNAPYISLDRNEDNRYAKINFGGFLEDTRVGSVVLEADKLFKTMSTGLDPNTRLLVKRTILDNVADFLTEDERALYADTQEGSAQIRYWFYPDRIRAVTDGQIAAVDWSQFMADAERMDKEVPLGMAQRETIDHLNQNFDRYAQALPTLAELQTVGRMMAIVTWLHQSDANKKVDLDRLLSVELSPFNTPRRTHKMLAATVGTSAGSGANSEENHTVLCLDQMLEGMSSTADDDEYLRIAEKRLDDPGYDSLLPRSLRQRNAELNTERARLERMEFRLKDLQERMERERSTLNEYNPKEVNRFNAMVDDFNSLRAEYRAALNSFNRSVGVSNGQKIKTHTIVSVGGGISLRPADFAKPVDMPGSPILQRIRNARIALERNPSDRSVGLTRSALQHSGSVSTGKRRSQPWISNLQPTQDNVLIKRWSIGSQGVASFESDPKSGYARYYIATKGYFSDTTVKVGGREMVIAVSTYPAEIVASGNPLEGGRIVLKRGTLIDTQTVKTPESIVK